MNEVSAEYIKAVELNRKIITSAQFAQQSLYDMCMGFKEMRDSKLYKELGYQNFEEYCEKETNMNRRNVYKYISVAENLPEDFVSLGTQMGVRKLYLLSTLSESDRTEIIENNDFENTTVKELEQQIQRIKAEKDKAIAEKSAAELDAAHAVDKAYKLEKSKEALNQRLAQLQAEIKELENRPIEVAVAEPVNGDRLLKETIKSLERENIKQNEALEETYRIQTEELRKKLEREKQEAIDKLEKEKQDKLNELKSELETVKSEYEQKLAEVPQSVEADDNKVKFKILLTSAFDSLKRLSDFIKANPREDFTTKVKQLITAIEKEI